MDKKELIDKVREDNNKIFDKCEGEVIEGFNNKQELLNWINSIKEEDEDE